MKIADLNGKRICILGRGKEGLAMEEALRLHAPGADVTIRDQKDSPDYLKGLSAFDVIIKSPGIPHQKEFNAVKEKMTSSTQIFFDSIKDSGATVIGVTGSKGKSTTSALIYEILKAGGEDVFLIGNIGEPAISHLDDARAGKNRGESFNSAQGRLRRTVFVLEMSSYQLMDLTVSPQIAVVTSFFPEHLDYHGTLAAYKDAKKHIAKFQTKEDVIFYNATSDGAKEIAMESAGTRIPFSADDCPIAIKDTHLLGDHNRSNIAVAWKVGIRLGIANEIMLKAIHDFPGLPHRLQSLGVHHKIEWIDDAISTTPESTIAALDALGDRVKTIILGGQDRGNDFAELAARIKRSAVKTVILFPGSGPRIRAALETVKTSAHLVDVGSMTEAVEIAKKNTPAKSICLLSTASPSYNMFKNFEEKGEEFSRCIRI